jgi:hypothetical protein
MSILFVVSAFVTKIFFPRFCIFSFSILGPFWRKILSLLGLLAQIKVYTELCAMILPLANEVYPRRGYQL